MSKYKNHNVFSAKNVLGSRLQFILQEKLKYTTQRAIASRVGMSPNIISKVTRGIVNGVSFDALLELAQRLNLKYKLVMEYNGTGRGTVDLILNPVHATLREHIVNKLSGLFTPLRTVTN